MIKTLYLEIEKKLKSIKDNNNNPLIQHFDLWNNQIEFLEQETPFNTPAVFVEFLPMQWRTLGNRIQDCELHVRLHIVTSWFCNTAEYTPTVQRMEALNYLTLPSTIVFEMQNFGIAQTETFGGCNSWTRTKSQVNHNHERYVDSIEEYKCNLIDFSAKIPMIPIQTTPKITLNP